MWRHWRPPFHLRSGRIRRERAFGNTGVVLRQAIRAISRFIRDLSLCGDSTIGLNPSPGISGPPTVAALAEGVAVEDLLLAEIEVAAILQEDAALELRQGRKDPAGSADGTLGLHGGDGRQSARVLRRVPPVHIAWNDNGG